MNIITNACYLSALGDAIDNNLIYYSHLIPVFFTILLSLLVFLKARTNVLSKAFLAFSFVFSLWLIGDLITWVSTNYYLIYSTWSLLVYLEVVFFVLGFYFATVFVRKSDIPMLGKFALLGVTIFPMWITITQQSVTGFNYPACEAFNSSILDTYKLYLEFLILGITFVYSFFPFFKKEGFYKKKSSIIMLGSMFLFLSVFGITEYLASITGNYELNLYALFVIPIFLIAITYSIFSLDIFNIKVISTYFLVFGFLILMGSQLLFVADKTDQWLTALTLILSLALSYVLFKNLHKESEQRIYIEKLNIDLQNVIKQRESLVHLITHKVKGSFTRTKYIFAGLLDGTFGSITPEVKKMAEQGLEFDNGGIQTVDLVLNVANLQNGLIKYNMQTIDFKDIVEKTINEKKVPAEAKGLQIETDFKEGTYNVTGDAFWLKEIVSNLLDNSIHYTPAGKIMIGLEVKNSKLLLSVKDTGLGITEEDKLNLFKEGGRGKDSVRVNVDSTGYGLFTVKMVIQEHKGRVWGESEGAGKGSQFYVELPTV
jgi:signal transduction histidine kinase